VSEASDLAVGSGSGGVRPFLDSYQRWFPMQGSGELWASLRRQITEWLERHTNPEDAASNIEKWEAACGEVKETIRNPSLGDVLDEFVGKLLRDQARERVERKVLPEHQEDVAAYVKAQADHLDRFLKGKMTRREYFEGLSQIASSNGAHSDHVTKMVVESSKIAADKPGGLDAPIAEERPNAAHIVRLLHEAQEDRE
jgi:hypothetical protein